MDLLLKNKEILLLFCDYATVAENFAVLTSPTAKL